MNVKSFQVVQISGKHVTSKIDHDGNPDNQPCYVLFALDENGQLYKTIEYSEWELTASMDDPGDFTVEFYKINAKIMD